MVKEIELLKSNYPFFFAHTSFGGFEMKFSPPREHDWQTMRTCSDLYNNSQGLEKGKYICREIEKQKSHIGVWQGFISLIIWRWQDHKKPTIPALKSNQEETDTRVTLYC